jgi:hypothetical protein
VENRPISLDHKVRLAEVPGTADKDEETVRRAVKFTPNARRALRRRKLRVRTQARAQSLTWNSI